MLWYFGSPVPAGIRWPQITFSFSFSSGSLLPSMAASFSTLVVSWNDAADMKLLVCSAARVIPCRIWFEVAGMTSRTSTSFWSLRLSTEFSSRNLRTVMIIPARIVGDSPGSVTTTLSYSSSLTSMNSHLSTICSGRKRVSPGSSICTLFIIWRTITSKCLSLIFTPCMRYTSCTSLTMYS